MARLAQWLSLLLVVLYGIALLSCGLDALPGPRQSALHLLDTRIVGWPWIEFGPTTLTPTWFGVSIAINFVLVALPFLPPTTLRRARSTVSAPLDSASDSMTETASSAAKGQIWAFALLGLVCLTGAGLLLARATVWPAIAGAHWELRPFATPLPTLGWIACLTAGLVALGAFGSARRLAAGDANALGSLLDNVGGFVRLAALTGTAAIVLAVADETANNKVARDQSEAQRSAGPQMGPRLMQQGGGGGQKGRRGGRPPAAKKEPIPPRA
jgi:hypothetical protein